MRDVVLLEWAAVALGCGQDVTQLVLVSHLFLGIFKCPCMYIQVFSVIHHVALDTIIIMILAAITCPHLTHPHGLVFYNPRQQPHLLRTVLFYMLSCPEGSERRGGEYYRTCTKDGSSAMGVWTGTAPICSGTHSIHAVVALMIPFCSYTCVSFCWRNTVLHKQ